MPCCPLSAASPSLPAGRTGPPAQGVQVWQSGAPEEAADRSVAAWGLFEGGARPGLALSASTGGFGGSGDEPDPDPAEPPLLIFTMVPWIVTPAGPTSTKFPPTFMVTWVPASMMTFTPRLQVDLLPRIQGMFHPHLFLQVHADLEGDGAVDLLVPGPP